MSNLHELSVTELANGLKTKQFSSLELTNHFLNRIEQFDKRVNSFITVTPDLAREQAKQADEILAKGNGANGNANPLTGIPLAHKDIFCTQGVLTTAGSKMLANFISPYNATIVEKCQNAGLVTLGKTSMDEFAMGSDNESSYFGAVHNPWDLSRVPGGSSGGSAAAVSAGFAPIATGSDTGGSIRQPASFCGLTGIKPTYGRVSRFGMIAYASSFDQAGSFGKSAEDCAYLLQTLAGHDPKDSTSSPKDVQNWVENLQANRAKGDKPLTGLRIGVPQEYFADGLQADVKAKIETALKQYEALGATLVDVHLTKPEITLATYYLLAPAEASSNLSRFDGVRYGYRCENPKDLTDLYTRSRSEGFGLEVQRRILMGTYALSAGYFDAYYVKAQKVRRLISQDFAKAFASCDVIATPTAPTPAYKIGASLTPSEIYMGDVYTIGVNLAGLPALSHTLGNNEAGLPIGLQLIGNHWEEGTILQVADAYQQVTDFHKKMANLG